jgi:hypothetical protein
MPERKVLKLKEWSARLILCRIKESAPAPVRAGRRIAGKKVLQSLCVNHKPFYRRIKARDWAQIPLYIRTWLRSISSISMTSTGTIRDRARRKDWSLQLSWLVRGFRSNREKTF